MDSHILNLTRKGLVMCAYLEEVPDEILGWSCTNNHDSLHYVYVKGTYRRQGIGTGLVPTGLKYYTHKTSTEGGLFLKSLGLEFNPFILEK